MFQKLSKWMRGRAASGEAKETARTKQKLQSSALAPPESLEEWYGVLGVPPGSDLKTVRHAWKQQLARHHRELLSEDVETKRRATLATNRINAAYRGLQDRLT